MSSELANTVKKLEKMKSLEKDAKDKLEVDIKNLQSQYDLLTERERKVAIEYFTVLRCKVIIPFHTVVIISKCNRKIIK